MATSRTYIISNKSRKEWRGGTQSLIVTPDLLKKWNQCGICLNTALDPYCCNNGDIFCKECILEYIINFGHNKESDSSEKKTNDKKRTQICRCPSCKKKIKWNKLLKVEITYNDDSPICPVCKKCISSTDTPLRLPCSHVFCEQCAHGSISNNQDCPLCSYNLSDAQSIVINKIVQDLKDPTGKITLKKEGLVDHFG